MQGYVAGKKIGGGYFAGQKLFDNIDIWKVLVSNGENKLFYQINHSLGKLDLSGSIGNDQINTSGSMQNVSYDQVPDGESGYNNHNDWQFYKFYTFPDSEKITSSSNTPQTSTSIGSAFLDDPDSFSNTTVLAFIQDNAIWIGRQSYNSGDQQFSYIIVTNGIDIN